MTTFVGDENDNTFSVGGYGTDTVDGRGGDDLVFVNLSNVAGDIDTFNSGGVITNHLEGTLNATVGLGNVERVNIRTGAGNDQLYLFSGDDVVSSGGGNDDIDTRGGSASVNGGAGIDHWTGDLSAILSNGVLDLSNASAQSFYGGTIVGVERLTLTLGAGNDQVLTLTGSAGRGLADNITAGAGNDVVRMGGGGDIISAGDGLDTAIIDFSLDTHGVHTFNSGGVITNDQTGGDQYTVGLGGVEQVHFTGGAGDDQLYLFGGDDRVAGGAGNDSINTRAGKAVVNGGAGIDIWIADLSTTTANSNLNLASSANQAFHGGAVRSIEAVELTLGSGNDTILTLIGAQGRGLVDNVTAGAGDDVVRVGGGRDSINGGEGVDTAIIDFSLDTTDITTSHSGGVVTNSLTGAAENTAFLGGVERVNITTGSGDDNLYLFGGDDTVFAGAGDDVVDTRTGAVVISGGAGRDTWIADFSTTTTAGVLDLSLDTTQSFLGGRVREVEAVQLTLGSGDDTVLTLVGAAAAGTNDNLNGGDGNDTFRVGGGRDSINGGAGDDRLIVDFSAQSGDITTSNSGGAISNNLSGLDEATVFVGGIERIQITTGAGDDSLFTYNGADLLNGGAGDDSLTANGGDDSLIGGTGRDAMSGGLGNDTYVVDNAGDTTVEQPGEGTDSVRASVSWTLGANVERLSLIGSAQINATGNALENTIVGSARANIITGGEGRDLMTGGGGADRFDFNAVSESSFAAYDRIIDLEDQDVIDLATIDASTGVAGDQSFVLVNAFNGQARQLTLTYNAAADFTVLAADVNGDGVADLRILLNGNHGDYDNFRL